MFSTLLHKTMLAAAVIMVLTNIGAAAQMPVMPAPLKAGDKVAIISPGSTPGNDNPQRAAATLREWGLMPVIGPNSLSSVHQRLYAGTVQQRASDLLWALRDTTIRAIVCTRGGYGAAMLLGDVTRDDLRQHPKWVVGYSDITALHSALVRSGVMSLHANMGGALGERGPNDSINLMLRDVLMGQLPRYEVPAHPYNQPGTATGMVVGGNMAVFGSLSGSQQWDFLDRDYIQDKDIILFFEDVSESMPRVNTMLQQLRLKGALHRVRGIIVGRFTDYKAGYDYADMNAVIHETLSSLGLDIPVCYDFPASHDESWNYPMIEGCPATLQVTSTGVTLTFNATR